MVRAVPNAVGGCVVSLAINIAYGIAILLLVIAIWRNRPGRRRPSEQERAAAARKRTALAAAPVIETEPGINLADQDACELLLDDPEFAARCDRLWQAIRDEQQKGDKA